MFTRFLIDVFITGCVIGMPLAVYCVWKFGPVEVMRQVGLHSEEEFEVEDVHRPVHGPPVGSFKASEHSNTLNYMQVPQPRKRYRE